MRGWLEVLTVAFSLGLFSTQAALAQGAAGAEQVCRDAAKRDGYEVTAVTDTDSANNTLQLELELRRDGKLFEGRCIPDPDNKYARLHDIEQQD